jgi:mannose-6-phosphate isomerase
MHSIQPLRFVPGYFEKIWGGHKIYDLFDQQAPPDKRIGESWLIADHPNHVSVVAEGPLTGQTLRELLHKDAASVLGFRPRLTIHGRFPLLLKILDAAEALSVQVHPDDAAALRLGEPDVGKTEMWHVLEAGPGAELICGLKPGLTRETFAQAIAEGAIEGEMERFLAQPGMTVFVPAGTVHAIGAGSVLAEIQQNSDITYRIYDWGRVDAQGNPRDLHLAQSEEVSQFGEAHSGAATPLTYLQGSTTVDVLGACRYFAGERLQITSNFSRDNGGSTFHILLGVRGCCRVDTGNGAASLSRGEALLIPGFADHFAVEGQAEVLDFYVPDLALDVITPLAQAGYDKTAIARLGGSPEHNDLVEYLKES